MVKVILRWNCQIACCYENLILYVAFIGVFIFLSKDLLLLLREPIHGRMDELMKEETETKRKMTHTRGGNSGRSEPHCFLVGE